MTHLLYFDYLTNLWLVSGFLILLNVICEHILFVAEICIVAKILQKFELQQKLATTICIAEIWIAAEICKNLYWSRNLQKFVLQQIVCLCQSVPLSIKLKKFGSKLVFCWLWFLLSICQYAVDWLVCVNNVLQRI